MIAVIDIETTGLNRFKDKITWIGIALHKHLTEDYKPYRVYTIDPNTDEGFDKCVSLFLRLLREKIPCVWQNGKFDTLWIEQFFGLKLPISHDVMLMGTVYDLAAEHGLKKMAQAYLGIEDWDIKKKEKLSGDKETVVPYLKLDLKYTYLLFVYFKNRLKKKQIKLYKKLLLPAFRLYRRVEATGIYFDEEQYQYVKREYAEKEQKILAELNSHYEINWNSSQQKAQVLYEQEKLPVLKLTPKGIPSSDKKVMKRLAAKGFEIPNLILEYSAVSTLNKMFLNRWGNDVVKSRLHPSFNLTNVISGRTSSSNPNLQQCPNDLHLRNLFTAPEGRVFFEADYSQLELRIAAHYADETTMLNIYRNHGDIHTATAQILVGEDHEVTKSDRQKAKSVSG